MSIGYNLVLPSGKVYKLRAEDKADCAAQIESLCAKWLAYCGSHWLSDNHEEPFCPENRVKRFLDGAAYCLMLGDTHGITTDYKRMADGNREIPLSACPAFIEDQVYGGGSSQPTVDDLLYLQQMKESLDEQAEKIFGHKKEKPKKRALTKSDKIRSFEKEFHPIGYEYPAVDTDGNFTVGGISFHISENCLQYAPKQVGDDLLYDMDKVVVANVKEDEPNYHPYFFDMNFDAIDNFVTRVKNG